MIPIENHKVTIKTLTPVHIGNGDKYDKSFLKMEEGKIAVIDLDYNKEDIQTILKNINNIDILIERLGYVSKYIKIYGNQNLANSDIDTFIYTFSNSDEIKYIPGSSLKGYLDNVLLKEEFMDRDIIQSMNYGMTNKIVRDMKKKIKDKIKGIGNIIIISDMLPQEYENFASYVNVYTLNRDNRFRIKTRSGTEIINGTFEGTISINSGKISINFEKLMDDVTEYTKWCVNNELEILESCEKDEIENYIDKLYEIKSKLENGKPIIRIGRYTGSIYKSLIELIKSRNEDMTKFIINEIIRRHKNYKYPSVIFPKTIKMLPDGTPLGFVEIGYNEE